MKVVLWYTIHNLIKRPSNDSAPFFNAMILFGSSQGSFCISLLASEVDEQ